jgi:transposase InsO family protein
MCTHMVKTIREERKRWVLPIIQKEIRVKDMAKVFPYSQRTLERWVASYKEKGEAGLEPLSTAPKTSPRATKDALKRYIVRIRGGKGKCAQKISWQLKDEGIIIHERTIGKILKKEGLVRKYRVKKIKYEYIRAERKPGELIEIDIKYVPGRIKGKRYYQYTAVDTSSRWRYMKIYPEQSGWNSESFLQEVIDRFPYTIQAVKTDNGFVFTNRYLGTYKRLDRMPKGVHVFDRFCNRKNIVHYLIDPGKPAQNGTVERSHRSDQESFYDRNTFETLEDLEEKLVLWNTEYNELAHCGLKGKSPSQFLKDYQLNKPTKVCT